MIQLGRHIEILLLSNDCVIVPELGGFMAYYADAHYDNNENVFLPPLRTLGFNPQLKLNDSLLAQSYIETYDISYPEAIRRINEEVSELKQHLNNKGYYELTDIGKLSLNEEGAYIFEPCEAGILTPELYGLCSFEINKIAETTTETIIQQAQAAQANFPTIDIGETKSENAVTIEDNESTIKIKVSWIRNAVSMAAAIIAFFFITTPISNSTKNNIVSDGLQTANVLGIPTEHKDIVPTGISKEIKLNTSKDSIEDKKTEKAVTQTGIIEDNKSDFCIVMASHVTKKNAEAYVQELHAKGYKEAYLYIHNNIVRVVYGNYPNENEAYSVLRNIRGNKYFEQSWVYKKR